MSAIYLVSLLALLLVCGLAALRGGPTERLTAGLLAAAWTGRHFAPWDRVNTPWIVIAIDCVVFLVLLYMALFGGRRWAVAAASFHFLALATHAAFALNHQLEQWAYVTAYYVWNLAVLAALGSGALWPAQGKNG